MNYGEIKSCDIANGEGIRVSLFVSGCTHHCKGCFNPQTWDFSFGSQFTEETEDYIINLMDKSYIKGFSLLGGEPFEPSNQKVLVKFLKRLKALFPGKNIWCYTGYLFDKDLLSPSRARCEFTDEMLGLLDVLVDGKFEEDSKDISLAYRGSANQRIIDVKKSLAENRIVLYNLCSSKP